MLWIRLLLFAQLALLVSCTTSTKIGASGPQQFSSLSKPQGMFEVGYSHRIGNDYELGYNIIQNDGDELIWERAAPEEAEFSTNEIFVNQEYELFFRVSLDSVKQPTKVLREHFFGFKGSPKSFGFNYAMIGQSEKLKMVSNLGLKVYKQSEIVYKEKVTSAWGPSASGEYLRDKRASTMVFFWQVSPLYHYKGYFDIGPILNLNFSLGDYELGNLGFGLSTGINYKYFGLNYELSKSRLTYDMAHQIKISGRVF